MYPRRFLFAIALLVSAGAFAQQHRMRMPPPGPGPDGPGGPGDFAFIRAEFGMAGRIVKGAPYSAQVVTQFTQTLADGNRIQRSSTGTFARDSEGRTRTERSLAAIGPLAASGDTSTTIFINDPVAAMNYVLDSKNHTARQMQMPANRPSGAPGDWQQRRGAGPRHQQASVKSDDLGTQVMEGVTVQGKRSTRTIPAGQMGNERAIDIVTETWYSPDLQAVVMSRTSDPRSGESLYKLTNISRAEPDHSLFAVPSDYTVQQGRGPRGNQ